MKSSTLEHTENTPLSNLGREELLLLLGGLETTHAHLGGGIDELDGDNLASVGVSGDVDGLAKSDDTLGGARDTTLDHDEVLVDLTIVDETTHGGDSLLGDISLGSGVEVNDLLSTIGLGGLANAVDLLVDLGTVEVTTLTSTSNGVGDTSRVPGTDTSDLTKTTVSLTGKSGDTPTADDTLNSETLGDADGINALVKREDGVDVDLLLEEGETEVDLSINGTTVDLDLHEVSLLLETKLLNLSVSENADNRAELAHALKLALHHLAVVLLVVSSSVLGESLTLGAVEVLVHATLKRVGLVVGPDGGEGTETTGSLGVTNEAANNHSGGFEDGDSLDGLLLIKTGAGLGDITKNVSHASLVTHEGGEVARLGLVILGERTDLTLVVNAALAGVEGEGTVTGMLKLTVRHGVSVMWE